jgi:hypothetical protein
LKKLNLAKVRSAIGLTIALVALLLAAPAAVAKGVPSVHLVLLPAGTTVDELAEAGFSPGLMSAGLGTVPPEQTLLDIGQGNRVFDSLYDEDLPRLGNDCAGWRKSVEERAESAPADIVPFLLSREARGHRFAVTGAGMLDCAFGEVSAGQAANEAEVRIAIAKPREDSDELVAIGVSGPGFDGNLTSDSTRMDGYVLSTDVAPTILDHFGIPVPSEMSGQPIRSEGEVDVTEIESLGDRLDVISSRRGPVIGYSLLLWLGTLASIALVSRGRLARPAVRVTGLAIVYMPLVLLLAAAIKPGETAEALLVMLGAPALAASTLALLRGYRALAAASALTVCAYAIDVIAGSPLTALSLLGPNPGLGVRFYGIGNELEAILAVLVVAGAGAALTGFAPGAPRRRCAVAFVASGLLAAFVFAAGRFGADVGAAIVLPVGAAVAAVVVAGRGRRGALWLVLAAPLAILALMALVDLVSGANAHLTRSVLDAGGLGDLSDVAQRRLQLSAHSFGRPVLLAFLPLVAAIAVLAVVKRDRLQAWLSGSPAMRAGLAGALAATALGTLANDSGALLLEVGTAYLLVFTGFAWAEGSPVPTPPTRAD